MLLRLLALALWPLLLTISTAHAAQYEPTLLEQRSLRYQTSFGLFEDDPDGFFRPRLLYRWEGERFASQLTQLTPTGEAALGYGNGITGGWSWSLYAGGGYGYEQVVNTRDRIVSSGTANQPVLAFSSFDGSDKAPLQSGKGLAALGISHALGSGNLGLGIQARWLSENSQTISGSPTLLSLPSPDVKSAAGFTSIRDLDTGRLFEESRFSRTPETETDNLTTALVAGYAVRSTPKNWGWAIDILGGARRLNATRKVRSTDSSNITSASTSQSYSTDESSSGISPMGGVALTLSRATRNPFWLDLGASGESGVALTGLAGTTTGARAVTIRTGGLRRTYKQSENRIDSQSGVLGRRMAASAGVRQLVALDPLLQFGWGLHAGWAQSTSENSIVSFYDIAESLDVDGNGKFDGADVRMKARGEGHTRENSRLREVTASLPMALVIRSSNDASLEWRLAGELTYRNTLLLAESKLESLVLPSGTRINAGGASAPVRYTNATYPAGTRTSARKIGVASALKAGLGYWITTTAKIDAVVSAAPRGNGFLSFEDKSAGISALLAF